MSSSAALPDSASGSAYQRQSATACQLSIVVPCYNESGNIPLILERFRAVLAGRGDVEVVLVNNGSTDRSAEALASELAKPENAFARAVHVPVNQGYGYGIVSGLRDCRGAYLAWTHADLQTDPLDVLLGFQQLGQAPDPKGTLIRGRRRGRGVVDRFFTWGMGVVASLALQTPLHDINAQPKLFHRSFLELLPAPPDDFSLDLYALYQAAQHQRPVLELPVDFGLRKHGEAKGGGTLRGKMRLVRRTFAYIFALRHSLRRQEQAGQLGVEPVRRAA
ncbi:MAG: glycosyltransferase family 2 protein [Planctomycetes bacterium]|nr:glycosyltransferase family 2 protein [Planctomycetota bacterium]